MADTHDPADGPASIDDLFAAFDSGEFDAEPVAAAERRRMAFAARVVPQAWSGVEPPPELRGRVLERIRAEAGRPAPPVADLGLARERRRRLTRPLLGALAAAAIALAVAIGLTGGNKATSPKLFDAQLAVVGGSPSPAATGGTEIHRGSYGYEVWLDAEGLAPTTGGQSYELWYVGRGDTRAAPVRVAIGSFRTTSGVIHTRYPAAFDGARFNRVSITLQPPNNGDPSRIGPEVLAGPSLPVGGK